MDRSRRACYALEAPAWDRFGSFGGQPQIARTVMWTTADRRGVIKGRRGDERFEELRWPDAWETRRSRKPV